MNLAEIDLLRLYQLVLLCAGVAGLLVGLPRLWRLVTRFRKLPADFRQAAIRGGCNAARRFVREEWPKLVALSFCLLLLGVLLIAIRMI